MRYPQIPYKGSKTKKMLTNFLGINLTDNFKEGEFADMQGLSSEHYPTITQRAGRELVLGYDSVTDLFEWNDKLAVVSGTMLYFDGVPITNVSTGRKQFAVVNTHLVVMPDKIDIDTTSEYYDDQNVRRFKYKILTAEMHTSAAPNSATFSEGTKIQGVTAGYKQTFQADFAQLCKDGPYEWSVWPAKYCFYTYGKDVNAVKACWRNGAWDWDALSRLERLSWFDTYHPGAQISKGDILIPKVENNSYNIVEGTGFKADVESYPNKALYNNFGYYMVFNWDDNNPPKDFQMNMGWNEQGTAIVCNLWYPPFDLYGAATEKWSDTFRVGDMISCSGAGSYDFSGAVIKSIDDSTNTMTVKGKNNQGQYEVNPFPTGTASFSTPLTFRRLYPDLDFICERGNRLWGVSNKDKTIYVSGLGLPELMFDYSETDLASYAVAVGSEGDFTAIYNYGGATCCFKEKRLIKILGDNPSNFYMAEYEIDGVQTGSEKSLEVINETLLYKGVNGVYTFNGSAPSLISGVLGRDVFNNGVGGSDGERYYLSVSDAKQDYLFTYDLVNGIWMKEDDIRADAFTRTKDFYMAAGGKIYKLGVENGENFDWMAEFKPFYTMASAPNGYSRSAGKQGYTKLILGMEMSPGSRITIETKQDNKLWKRAYTKVADSTFSTAIPLMIGRCDLFRIRLKGYGAIKIRFLEREYVVGTER